MKKSKLIELLNGIEGDPDVMIWNGYADDFNPIAAVEQDILYKESVEHLIRCLKHEYCLDKKCFDLNEDETNTIIEQAKHLHKKREYGLPNPYVIESEKYNWYQKKTKKVVTIVPKMIGKTNHGRHKYEDVNY